MWPFRFLPMACRPMDFRLYINTPRSALSAVVGSGNAPPKRISYVDIGYTPLDNLDYGLAPITMHETLRTARTTLPTPIGPRRRSRAESLGDWDAANHRFLDRLSAFGYATPTSG